MAKVVLPLEVARAFAGGIKEISVDARDVRELIDALDLRFPGIGERLRTRMAVAIDGEIFQEPFVEAVGERSEVFFLPAIEGG
jgi:molybdopterin converting factor small subunit